MEPTSVAGELYAKKRLRMNNEIEIILIVDHRTPGNKIKIQRDNDENSLVNW